ncbi:hypothetical protein IJ00_09240 [Calothrix sp. 336/3]|nr:hypothetical protein IJ00_09240 [Calothrix sp. 336/3]
MSLLPYVAANASTSTDTNATFVQSPKLVSATTPYTDTSIWGATYYFTVEIPTGAKQPLQKLTFNQTAGVDTIEFDHQNTIAWEGTSKNQGKKLAVTVTKERTLTVSFDRAIAPGSTVTIGLRPYKNPMAGGIYLFGVTAFPPEQTTGEFLGFGRLQFYAPNMSQN